LRLRIRASAADRLPESTFRVTRALRQRSLLSRDVPDLAEAPDFRLCPHLRPVGAILHAELLNASGGTDGA
jgi:hypothetical protein